ncbi:TIGR03747 family integrating conjugative element membrane protein [Glaesserella parasuis]|uniref:TIGR03747 family integrating conjugative element membrane protein n=1 Tax=Glaesserella parasuis TaxID=738 RepID=UPI0003AC17BF|nr:TIGR03747 family integrating conjugative element membrane protein [Glaesserella parasuis]ATW43748.1 integrating conjugative element membrane protein [Glaesserella parasuis D74]EQA10088.1 hypothetical protein HPSD74_0924 [Glaesserella parasuis D74]MDP0317182.1 TIGR03747 family integrating conjugative element membrane protein [Glaesserella parasuis]
MSEETKPRRKSGLISLILGKINMLLAAIAVSLIFSIILEWVGIAFWWPEEGHLHSQTMMLNEMQWLSDDFSQSLFAKSSTAFATSIIEHVYNWLFVYTGIKDWLLSPGNGSMEQWIHHYGRAYIESVIYVVITFIIRLIIIIFTSPLFLLTALSGLTEGLSLRDIRKFGAGRESAYLYHHARRYIMPMMVTAWVVYLSIPFSIHPNVILVPAACLFGLSICITAASFKKFL